MTTRKEMAERLGISVEELASRDRRGKHGNHAKGPRHPRWSGKRLRSSHGYVKVRVGKSHPLADSNGYAYEHTLVWNTAGRHLEDDEVIHHRNGDKTDNRLENLEALTRQEHAAEHDVTRDPETGRYVGKKASGSLLDGREWREVPR